MSNQPNILIISLSGIGNLIMQSVSIELIKHHHPNSTITLWLAPRSTKKIAEQIPSIDHIIEAPIKQPILKHLALISYFRKQRFTVGIVMSPGQLIKSGSYLFLSGIPVRIGHKYPLGNQPHSSFLLSHPIDEQLNLHDIEQNLNLLGSLGITPSIKAPAYSLDLPTSIINSAETKFNQLNIQKNKTIIGFHPGSAPDHAWKRWPAQNFCTLGRKLCKEFNGHIFVFGGPKEENLKNQIIHSIGPSQASVISSDLLTSAALMKKCALFISNDSGLMHISAALKTPTLGLFGPTNENQTGPRGYLSFSVRAPNTSPTYHTENNFYLGTKPHPTIKALKIDHILDKIQSQNLL